MAEWSKAPVFYHAEGCGFDPPFRQMSFLLRFCPRVYGCVCLKKGKKEKFLYRQLSPIKKLEAYSATRGWATTVK